MAEPRAKVLDYSITLDRRYRVAADGGDSQQLPKDFAPEHLLLAGMKVGASSAAASGRVTRRASDGRYAFVELDCSLEVELKPAPDAETQQAVLAKAERDCFVGASFVAPVRYAWRVNGNDA